MKEMVEWIKATSDIMVRVLLGQEKNLPLLKDFINAVLKDRGITPVKDLTIKNPITMRNVFDEKEPILDVKATDETGRILDVEIQSQDQGDFVHRSLYYWSRLYSEQMKKGNEYGKLNPVICINLIDFVLFKEKSPAQYHSCHMIGDLDDPETLLTDHLRTHYIELPKIKPDPSVIPTDRLVKWMYYFKEEGILEDDEMKVIFKDDPIFEQAHETFQQFTADDELKMRYEAREKLQRDQASAKAFAVRKAREEEKKETSLRIATSLKEMGEPVEIICKATGLTAEEVEAL